MKQYLLNLLYHLLALDEADSYVLFCFPHNLPVLAEKGKDWWQANMVLVQQMGDIRPHLKDLDLYFSPINGLQPLPVPAIPTVITLPDTQETAFPHNFLAHDLAYRDWYHRASASVADRIITLSQFSKQAICSSYRVPADKVTVAYPGVDTDLEGNVEEARHSLDGLPPAYAFYPANRWAHKNHDRLLAAIRLLRDEYDLTIPLVCSGHDVATGSPLRDTIARYGLQDVVHDRGYVSAQQMATLYRHARLLIFPSLYEGFGLPLVEAMAAGCPIAAAGCTSIPEVVGQAGLLFDPWQVSTIADALRELWNDGELRASLAQQGRQRVREFSIQRMVTAHQEAFHQARRVYSGARCARNRTLVLPYFLLRVLTKKATGVYGRRTRHA